MGCGASKNGGRGVTETVVGAQEGGHGPGLSANAPVGVFEGGGQAGGRPHADREEEAATNIRDDNVPPLLAQPVPELTRSPGGEQTVLIANLADEPDLKQTAPTSMAASSPRKEAFLAGISQEVLHAYRHLKDRRTKIVGTLGPASIPKIEDLIVAGINCFRLNFSHVTDPETQTPIIRTIRETSARLGLPVAILGDLCGPKIRCGTFATESGTIALRKGEAVSVVCSTDPGKEGVITTPIGEIVREIEVGHRVLLDDGSISLKVAERVSATEVKCEVVVGGTLKSHKGINVPDMSINLPALTAKDRQDAVYMYKHRLDYVALSFVQKPQDVQDLLDHFEALHEEEKKQPEHLHHDEDLEEDWRPYIISKIEKPQALDIIDDIITISDGIMVARGDLGVECSLEQVPVIQKTLIRKCNLAEKPVITATQMLESMINSPVPTRAEVSDVANAMFDGTDAVMLSAECATGQYPVETVQMMASVCRTSEAGDSFMHPHDFTAREMRANRELYAGNKKVTEFSHSIADAAVAAGTEANATAIMVFTTTGEMTSFVSKRRPNFPIIAITPIASVYRRSALYYGVHSVLSSGLRVPVGKGKVSTLKDASTAPPPTNDACVGTSTESMGGLIRNTDAILALTERDIMKSPAAAVIGLKEGDPVVYCAGFHHPFPGLSNTIKMSRFGDAFVNSQWKESLF
ncbi:hypothetical protein HK101_008582 [Irineochytrium annulatum]|nr:hypothetical protein HK101_008582 [Irineochytrium annulatum]